MKFRTCPPQILRNQPELLQRLLQILDYLGGKHPRRWQVVRILPRLVFELDAFILYRYTSS